MHSAAMEVQDVTLTDAFDGLLQFLQDKTHLHQLPEVQAAVKKIQEVRIREQTVMG